MGNAEPILTLIHFNDVYDIQQMKKGGKGAINFEAKVRKIRKKYPNNLLLFSGDAFSPSVLTNIYQGDQMVEVLNKLQVDAACMGNHEFDLQSQKTQELFRKSNFPWLMGNILVKSKGCIIGKGLPYMIKIFNGKKIGMFGVGGEDWIQILSDQYEDDLQYLDANDYSTKMCQFLRGEQQCDIIIALTHMRNPQDQQLARKVSDIDIILGGHDHVRMRENINSIPVIKSGDNFKSLSVINVFQKGQAQEQAGQQFKGKNFDFAIQLHEVEDVEQKDCNADMASYVNGCWNSYKKFDKLVGYCDNVLNTASEDIRSKETNYGNFVADLIRANFNSQCSILNSGCIRADCKVEPGQIKYSFLSNIINDLLIVKKISGQVLLKVLEKSVSGLPDSFGGNFLLVSGIRYKFDHRKTPKVQEVQINGKMLKKDEEYSVAINHYIASGGDGFDMLKPCQFIVDEAKGIELLSLLMNFFKLLSIQERKMSKKINIAKRQLDAIQSIFKMADTKNQRLMKLSSRIVKVDQDHQNRGNIKRYICIAPGLDGRIINLAQQGSTQGKYLQDMMIGQENKQNNQNQNLMKEKGGQMEKKTQFGGNLIGNMLSGAHA